MKLDAIIKTLQEKSLALDESIFGDLKKIKADAVTVQNETLANEIWFFETVAKIQSDFLQVYSLLKADENRKYEAAWCQLERIEVAFSEIRDNYPDRVSEFNLDYIEKTVFDLQKLFPYILFGSREMVIKSSKCSICGQKTSLRNPCAHKLGKLYFGELCCQQITDAEWLSISIVKNPFDKFSVMHMEGVEYNYGPLQRLMINWDNPYADWDIDVLDVLKPEFKKVGRNDSCPCNSGKKYKRCCLDTPNERMEHFRITFKNKMFAETPMDILNTTQQN